MNFRRVRHRLRKSIAEKGILTTAATLLRKGLERPLPTQDKPKIYEPVHPFDRKYGVDTSGLIYPEDLATGKKKDLFNAGYFGVAPSALRQILDYLALDFRRFTFVDLGSGKGRALLIASEYPFHAIMGVELSPSLHATAESNITRYRGRAQQCRNILTTEADATEFDFPAGPLLVYLWNPFELPVFRKVLANLEGSLAREPREAYVAYIQPDLEHMLATSDRWRKLWRREFALSEEDYAAHAFPARYEICAVYVPADSRADGD